MYKTDTNNSNGNRHIMMICFVQLKKALLGPKCLVEVQNSVSHALYAQEFLPPPSPCATPDTAMNLYSIV